MRISTVDGVDYRLPGALNAFQQELYLHLIRWKWEHITREPGVARGNEYDAILPKHMADDFPMLHPSAKRRLIKHIERFPFRIHTYFNHMASSQAANANLFLPILGSTQASSILGGIKPDLAKVATEYLDEGFRIEFWDEGSGNLGDKTEVSGTDSDIGIAYYNHAGELCLWLIEHKLTEAEFTECGGFKSKGRKSCHDCSKSFDQIIADKDACYYHSARKFNYWNITERNQEFFVNQAEHSSCPFSRGMNQLWRNQILGLAIEQDDRQPYKHVTFSVVHHPDNHHLDKSIDTYRHLIDSNPKFSVFTSAELVEQAGLFSDRELAEWIGWYKDLYHVNKPINRD